MPGPLRRLARAVHPRRLAAIAHQRSFRFDPAELPRPIPAPGPYDFIVTGCPRSGTSLAGAVLFQPPRALCLVEPWDGMRLPPAELFATWRNRILATGRVDGGTLDFDLVREGRVKRIPEGSSVARVDMDADFRLGVKWPSFHRYLPELPDTRFVICLRHPFEILASMRALDGSRVQEGLDYDTAFNREQNRTVLERAGTSALRRIELFDYVHERLLPWFGRPNVFVLRYERWFDDPDTLLAELGDFLGTSLSDSPIRVERREGRRIMDADDRSFVLRHSRMAPLLGYSLSASGVD